MERFSVSAVIPVYNEVRYIGITFQCIYDVLSKNFEDFEIIFVDDGSDDGSLYVLSAFNKQHQYVKVLQNACHYGLGAALNKGFKAAAKEVVFYIDCDLPYDPLFIIKAVPFLEKYDIVIGQRDRWDNILRKICSYCYNFIIRALFHTGVKDVNIGIKVFKRNIMDRISLNSNGAFIAAELILKATEKGLSVKGLPCNYKKRLYGRSKSFNIGNILLIVQEMLSYYFNKRNGLVKRKVNL